MEQNNSQHKLPAGLAGVLNPDEDQRDSAYYSIQDTASRHTSTQSSNAAVQGHSSAYDLATLDHTPSPIATNNYTQAVSSTTGGMSVASMVSPVSVDGQTTYNRYGRSSYEVAAGLNMNADDSRRQSMSSLGISDLNLAGGRSPYASHNQSTTSLQSNLQHQRHPGAHQDRNSAGRMSNSYAPQNQRLPDAPLSPVRHMGPVPPPKTAPIITGPAPGNFARASDPTKGQAWAFPEEEVQRLPSAARPSGENGSRVPSYINSRRSSLADSIASSQYTTESRYPPGQRRLSDGMPADFTGRTSSERRTHHHSLAHKSTVSLHSEGNSPTSTQPYSRTPELRVSHKLAERKRRTEMKDLFDTLRDLMPQERGSKASKWEILTKAISEHKRLVHEVNDQRSNNAIIHKHAEEARNEAYSLRNENTSLRNDLRLANSGHASSSGLSFGHGSSSDQRINGTSHKGAELPPIRGPFMGEDMTGVQFNESSMHMGSQHRPASQVDRPRVNHYQTPVEQHHPRGYALENPFNAAPPSYQQHDTSRPNGQQKY